MRILLDTHAFLWFVFADPKLSKKAERLISDPKNTLVLSHVSLWEMAVKVSIEKLKLGQPFETFVDQFVTGRALELMQIEIPHFKEYVQLPVHHRDPFDRLLIAQAKCEGLPVLSEDGRFKSYKLKVIW